MFRLTFTPPLDVIHIYFFVQAQFRTSDLVTLIAVNGSENSTGETTDSVDGLDLNDNARMVGCIGVDTEFFVSSFSDAAKFRVIIV